ncbi:O-antigen ligase domain-containing protein [Donghicola sp. C2-DW-16]|uniref:O-antigen ligase domain-containing protein n=1 Tax=Donghicola mangrovi TaxID=2729614 RepID=A0ABX2PEQ9_9RHOB|nr:O-antigen ligase family protein [Donghicola mangrovi]NVO27990.1 O-antigen ligase domain-containing protein [Donghicola mangrovi]
MVSLDAGQSVRRVTQTVASGAKSIASAPLLVRFYLIALFLPLDFQLGPLAMNALRLYLLIVIVPLFVRLVTGHYGRLIATDILFLLHLCFVSLSLAANNPSQLVSATGSASVEFLGGYLVARAAIRDRESFAGFCSFFALLVMLSLAPALVESLTGRALVPEMINKLPFFSASMPFEMDQRMGLNRVLVVFPHPILYGLVCSTAISLVWVGLRNDYAPARKAWESALVTLATFLSLSSGALLAAALQFLLIGWQWILRTVKARWIIFLGLIAVAYVVVDVVSTRSPMRVFLTYATFSAHSAYTRLYIFEWGMVNVWRSPWLGIGLNDWVRPPYMGGSVDNFWLLTTMRWGIPAFLSLAGSVIYLVIRVALLPLAEGSRISDQRRAWVFTICGLCVTLTTVHVWAGSYSYIAFLFGAGAWFLNAPDDEDEPEADAEESATGSMYRRKITPVAYSRSEVRSREDREKSGL